MKIIMQRKMAAIFTILLLSCSAKAQLIPPNAEGLEEQLIELTIDGGVQRGVMSKRIDQPPGSKLVVLLPGYPSVVRPEMSNGVMVSSPLAGNFLIRARRHLADDQVMTLLVDCHSSVGDICKPEYQASEARYRHVKAIIDAAKIKVPSIRQVYLLSTSAGSISSAFIAKQAQEYLSGVIHTASIDPTAPKSYPQLTNFNYAAIGIPQAFIHHTDDPCAITQYSYIRSVAEKYKIPLITVAGVSGFTGNPCAANTQHGFKGKEIVVMKHILKMVRGSLWISEEI